MFARTRAHCGSNADFAEMNVHANFADRTTAESYADYVTFTSPSISLLLLNLYIHQNMRPLGILRCPLLFPTYSHDLTIELVDKSYKTL